MRKPVHARIRIAARLSLATAALFGLACGSSDSTSIAKSMGGQAIREIVFAPDGDRIAYVETPKMLLFGAEVFTQLGDKPEGETWLVVKPLDGKPHKLFKLADGSKSVSIRWRSETNEIVFGGRDVFEEGDGRERIYLVTADGGTPEELVDGNDFSISRDGRRLAFVRTMYTSGRGNEGLFVLDLDTRVEIKISDMECKHPRWSRSSDELVYTAVPASEGERSRHRKSRGLTYYYGDVYVYDASYGLTRQVTTDGIFENPDFSPDATTVLASSYDALRSGRQRSLVVIDKTTGSWEVLLAPCDAYNYFGEYDFLPDTGELVFEGRFDNPSRKDARARDELMDSENETVTDLFVVGLDGSGLRRLDTIGHQYKGKPLFSPDGEIFVYRIEYADWNSEFFSVGTPRLSIQ
jgi:Tol biopolymer transport system component